MLRKILQRIRGDRYTIKVRLDYNLDTHMWDITINNAEYDRRSQHSVLAKVEDAMREARIEKMQKEVIE